MLTDSSKRRRAASAKSLVIFFESGPRLGESFVLPPRTVVLGRAVDCDIAIADPRVSKTHCAITWDGEVVEVSDLGSANGTFLNGKSIQLALAQTGDKVVIGDTGFRLDFGERGGTIKYNANETPSANQTPRSPVKTGVPREAVEIPGLSIKKVLGQGGTSTVFLAQDPRGGAVAVKVLKASECARGEDRERFIREIQVVERLSHPGIVRVLGHGETNGRLYSIMELVRGVSVASKIRDQGRLPLSLVLDVGRQIAAALDYARQGGVVHRDVKPDNIVLQEEGAVKLVDFGLAKPMFLTTRALGPTRRGDVLGTLAYMSPEQLQCSLTVDHRSDVYSLGATLYHMLVGEPPFEAPNTVEYFAKILYDRAPFVTEKRPDVPQSLAAVVSRCLEKRREDRYQTAGAVLDALTPPPSAT